MSTALRISREQADAALERNTLLQEAALPFAQLEDPESEAGMWSCAATILERAHRPEESADAWGHPPSG